MDLADYDRLVPEGTPEPWLAVLAPNREDYVVGVADSEESIDKWGLMKQWITWIKNGDEIVVVKDAPSLHVHYRGGLYSCGVVEAQPAHLAARRNWFLRYRDIVDPYLEQPLPTLVQCFARQPLKDLLSTMRSTLTGPCPLPTDVEWPLCGECGEPMSFIGAMDFRDYRRVGSVRNVPDGSLVLHTCIMCGMPCREGPSTLLTWITVDTPVALRTLGDSEDDCIEVGIAYETIEFPNPECDASDLSDDPAFVKEWGIERFFTCPLNKVGGHASWIQGDATPEDANGDPMQFIGQFIGSRDIDLVDTGCAYIFFSEETQETTMVLQFY